MPDEISPARTDKLWSGRFLWCIGCLALFCTLAGMGKIPADQVMTVITLVLGFYFGQGK